MISDMIYDLREKLAFWVFPELREMFYTAHAVANQAELFAAKLRLELAELRNEPTEDLQLMVNFWEECPH